MQQDAPLLATSRDGAIATITLTKPENRNALSLAMMTALQTQLAELETDPKLAVILLAAEGPAFSAGHDLREITAARQNDDAGQAFFSRLMESCSRLMLAVNRCRLPVIAVVEGVATAAGCQLVASCDLAIAGADARFATPGVHIGLFCSTPMVAVSRKIPRKAMMRMLLTGEMITAEDAAGLGLVNEVVEPGTALATANDLAATIAAKPQRILNIGKQAFYDQAEMPVAEAYAHTAQVMISNMLATEAVEGISAFLEKRPPVWPAIPKED